MKYTIKIPMYLFKTIITKTILGKKIVLDVIQKIHFLSEIHARHGKIYLGEKITLGKRAVLAAPEGIIKIGNFSFLNRNCLVICKENITIGENCSFGPNVCIYDHDHVFDETGFYNSKFSTGTVEIGDRCWIGANTVILKNTKIGEGCIIGAGCVIKGEIPPYSLVKSNRELQITPLKKEEKI